MVKRMGTSKNDVLKGDDTDEELYGVAGNDQLFGGAGNDLLDGGSGNDKLYGEAGNDTLVYVAAENKGATDSYNGGSGIDTLNLVLTRDEWMLAKVQADIQRFVTFLDRNVGVSGEANSNPFKFSAFGLTAVAIEKLTVGGDGNGVIGTNGDDSFTLQGTAAPDFIAGLGGNDVVSGDAGDDVIYGGEGNDSLSGDTGNDLLDGGAGDDRLTDEEGNSRMIGGSGNDSILVMHASSADVAGGDGNDQILVFDVAAFNVDGGAGDDSIDVSGIGSGQKVLGGTGNDTISLDSSASGLFIDAGAGNDEIHVRDATKQNTITTGSGLDEIWFENLAPAEPVLITDFHAGKGGDAINFGLLYQALPRWDQSANPFSAGFLRVIQSGKNTLLQADTDGAENGAHYVTFATLQNVNANDLKSSNIVPGYDPHGAAPRGMTFNGTEGNDYIEGGVGPDKMYGFGGADSLIGNEADDLIDGGAGNDTLDGAGGNDTIYGGDGDDSIFDHNGSNNLFGGAGNDYIEADAPVMSGSLLVDGGAGNDLIRVYGGYATILGGDGDDEFQLVNIGFTQTVSTGSGRDIIAPANYSDHGLRITDFTTGAGGDVLDYSSLLMSSSWNGVVNPLLAGFLEFQQVENDTVLRIDSDGAAGTRYSYVPAITLQGVTATELTKANLAPHYGPFAPIVVTGTEDGETLTGGPEDNIIYGLGGDDSLYALGGDDSIDGGEGNDSLYGGDGDDRLEDHYGDNTFFGGAGDDTIISSDGKVATIDAGEGTNNVQILSVDLVNVTGGSGNDRIDIRFGFSDITVNAGNGNNYVNTQTFTGRTTITTGADSDYVSAFGRGTLNSGDGSDQLYIGGTFVANAGAGDDRITLSLPYEPITLTTGPGADVITPSYTSRLAVITDFTVGRGGDALDLRSLLTAHADVSNIGQFVQLTSAGGGSSSNFVLDPDGSGSDYQPRSVLVLEHVRGVTSADLLTNGNLLVF